MEGMQDRHIAEMKSMHGRQREEMDAMHLRHASDMKDMHGRHAKEAKGTPMDATGVGVKTGSSKWKQVAKGNKGTEPGK